MLTFKLPTQSAELELFNRRVRIRQVSIPFASLRESQLAGLLFGLFIYFYQKQTSVLFKSKKNRTPFFIQKILFILGFKGRSGLLNLKKNRCLGLSKNSKKRQRTAPQSTRFRSAAKERRRLRF
ncbi:hypothetical protein [Methanimicrococcus hongohii]|uniref:hypothetical protein n=1 Tax=Methanimicrococcus hongohii TaxID=3028295 RepID=UPI00292F181A|nr:hypothetical protein [Methanimicrococcus sp. Hf6]